MTIIKKEPSEVVAKRELSEGEKRFIECIANDAFSLLKDAYDINFKLDIFENYMNKFELIKEVSNYQAIEYIDAIIDDCDLDYIVRYMRAVCKNNDYAICYFNECFANCINEDFLQSLLIENEDEDNVDNEKYEYSQNNGNDKSDLYESVESLKTILYDVISYIVAKFEECQREEEENEQGNSNM